MSEDLTQEIQSEVARVSALPLSEQPAAFAAIRERLEAALNSDDLNSADSENIDSGN